MMMAMFVIDWQRTSLIVCYWHKVFLFLRA